MRFFKRSCNICNKENKTTGRICESCLEIIKNHSRKRKCLKCGRVIPLEGESFCHDCQTEKFDFDIAASVYIYEGTFKEALLDFKFHGGFYRAKIFGQLMAEAVKKSGIKADYIIPVPITFNSIRKRGYNQATEMALCMKHYIKTPIIPGALIKKRKTAQQSALKPKERRKNIKDAFKVSKLHINKIKGKSILLADDVITTGATASECAKTLKEAGAEAVNVITLLISDWY